MKAVYLIHLLGVWLLLSVSCPIQAQTIAFNRILPTQATSWSGWITGITQDRQGYIWFTSSHGLYRYDGYQVTAYLHDLSNTNSLSAGTMETVYADQEGMIWIGSQSSGLDRLDPDTEIYTHFTHQPNDSATLSSNFVTAILEDHQGNLWVGTHAGLNLLDRKTGTFTSYQHHSTDTSSLSNDQVRVIYEDRQGTLWVGTGSPFIGESPEDAGGLNRLNRETGTFTRYLHNPDDVHSLADNQVRAVLEDSHGTFWVGTFGDGLHTMDRQRGTFQHYPYDPAHPERLSRPYLQKGNPNLAVFSTRGSGVSFIQEVNGEIWIGSNYGGLNRYNPVTKQMTHFEPDSTQTESLLDPWLWSAYTTRDGVLILGSIRSNVYRVSPATVRLALHPMPIPVSTFFEDTVGKLWLASGEGHVIQDRKTGQQQHFWHDPAPDGLRDNDWIHTLYSDRRGALWIGTQRGLFLYEATTRHFTHYRHEPEQATSIGSDTIAIVYEDQKGNIWVGTEAGLDQMNQKTATFTHFSHHPEDAHSLTEGKVVDLLEDRRGNFWVITRWSWSSGYLNRLDRNTGKVVRYPHLTDLLAMAEDNRGLWIASRNNLYCLAANTEEVTKFIDPQTGQGISGIQNMMQDDHGNLWVYTLSGLVQINATRDKIRRFQTNGNIQVTGAYQGKRSFYQGPKGEVFFGNQQGYYSFFPEQLHQPDTTPPQIVLHDFRLADQTVRPGAESPLKDPLFQTRSIELNHLQNAFSIGFAGIHYGQPELNQHLFQLEGYDPVWRQSGTEKTAYYYNIPPGQYTFRVKAANGDGIWAEKSLTILIHPPWWRTWWAYALYGFAFCGLLIGLIRYRLQLEREQQEMERKQWEAEQLKVVDEMKTRFFSNITHEFRTPLSLILPATEQLLKEVDEPRHNRGLLVIKRQAGQLLHLINQLLDLSKLEAGNMIPAQSQGDIAAYTSLLVDSFQPSAEEKGLTLRFISQLEESEWLFDADKWGKIVSNLLSNALKFTPGGGEVTLQIRLQDTPDSSSQTLILTVRDTGIGIAKATLPHIFDRFYQVDNSQTRTFEGSGIGLSLVKELVDVLDGHLSVDSLPGVGTTFTIAVPIAKAGIASQVPKVLMKPPDVSWVATPTNGTIETSTQSGLHQELPLLLVVEDHADLREFIIGELSKTYRVLTASNGRQGWELARQELPDVIISDVMMPCMDMPDMDGFALTERIKTDPATNHIAVVLLTAKAAQESKIAGLTHGADDYLTKPFHFDELQLRLRNLLNHQEKLHQHYQKLLTTEESPPVVESVQDRFWQALCQAIEDQLDNARFDVDALAEAVALSRRTLYRKLSTLTGLTPNEVIRSYRLKRAVQFLVAGQSISETAYQVGFESPSYFGQCFKETYHVTPSEYLQQKMAQS